LGWLHALNHLVLHHTYVQDIASLGWVGDLVNESFQLARSSGLRRNIIHGAKSCDFLWDFLMTFVTTKEEYENNLFFLHNVHERQFLTVFVLFL